jgi:hypothetical protein
VEAFLRAAKHLLVVDEPLPPLRLHAPATYPGGRLSIVRLKRNDAGNAARNDEGGLHLGILWIILIVILILALLGFFTRGRW